MIRRLIGAALLLVGTGALVGPAAPALAGGTAPDYADCVLTVDPSTFEGGAVVTVVGTGFQPGFETTLEFNGVAVGAGTVTVDATGGFTTQVTIPAEPVASPDTLTATCDAQINIVTTSVIVSRPSGPTTTTTTTGGGPLPRTGSDVEPLVVAGGAALIAGTAFVLVAKRRRRAAV